MTVASRARATFTMRAKVQENSTATVDDYGHPEAPSWSAKATVPCRVWSQRRRQVIDGDKAALVEDLRMAVALDANVAVGDRVEQVEDRRGTVLWAGPLELQAPQHKHTHTEWSLERVTS